MGSPPGPGGGGPAPPRSRPAAGQPVHRGVDVIGGRPGPPKIGAQGGIAPPGQGGQLRARPDHPGDDQRQGQVPLPACRAQQRGQPQFRGHGVHRGDVAVRQRPGDGDRLPGRHQPLAFQGGLDHRDRLGRERRQVRQRLMPDLAALAVGPAHQHRLIHPLFAGLRRIAALVPGYVHRAAACRHTLILAGNCQGTPERHVYFVATPEGRTCPLSARQSGNHYTALQQLRVSGWQHCAAQD